MIYYMIYCKPWPSMPNTYFAFKQFTIHQVANAMKVTTDACTFGALLPELPHHGAGMHLLDVGTGTGLLALMLAQKNRAARITALEIMPAAADEAQRNVAGTPIGKHIEVLSTDAIAYRPAGPVQGIVSNPPFYEGQLASPQAQRNVAHHSTRLELATLLQLSAQWLAPEGWLALLLPAYRQAHCIALAHTQGLYPTQCIALYSTTRHPNPFRSILFFSKNQAAPCTHSSLYIQDAQGSYTPAFARLLQPYYLKL